MFRSLTHGYDTVHHFTVDARLGDLADLDALVLAVAVLFYVGGTPSVYNGDKQGWRG